MAIENLRFATLRDARGIAFHYLAEQRIFITKLDRDADFTEVEADEKTIAEAEAVIRELEAEYQRLQRAEEQAEQNLSSYSSWIENAVTRYCDWTGEDRDRAEGETEMLQAIEEALINRDEAIQRNLELHQLVGELQRQLDEAIT
jgi:hypothetical protein